MDEKVENMLKVGAQFGSVRSRRHPSARPFVLGSKSQIDIIDLSKTSEMLERAKEFVAGLAKDGKIWLLVGTKSEAKKAIVAAAEKIGMPYVSERWIGGTLTNFNQIKKRLARLAEITEGKAKGGLAKYPKKERMKIEKELADLERLFGGIRDIKEPPHSLFVVDLKDEETAVREATQVGLSVVSVSSSDCDLGGVTWPIIANDRSRSSIKFFVDEIAAAYLEGKKK